MGFEITEEKQRWPPGCLKCDQWVAKMDFYLDHGLMSNWCEFERDRFKTLLCIVHTLKIAVSPLMATDVTYGWGQRRV